MNKIKVNKEFYDALNIAKEIYDSNKILKNCKYGFWENPDFFVLNGKTEDFVMHCLVLGMQFEETKEEELKRIYQSGKTNEFDLYTEGFEDGILCALNTLGIQIEGINK